MHFKAPFSKWFFFKANRSFTAEGNRCFCTIPVQNLDLQILTLETHPPITLVNGTAVDAEEGKGYCAILSLCLL